MEKLLQPSGHTDWQALSLVTYMFFAIRMEPFLDEIQCDRVLDLLHVLFVLVQLTAVLERERLGVSATNNEED